VNFFGEVVGLVFVRGDVGVTSEAKGGVSGDVFTGKERGAEVGNEVFEKDEATFIDESGARDGGREGEDDDAFIGFGWIGNGESEADVEGRDDLL